MTTAIAIDPKLRILEILRRQGATSIDQLTERCGLSKTAIRAHLLRLEDSEMIERVALAAAGPGRPPLAYQLTEQGGSVFPADDGAVLTRLLAFLHREGKADLIHSFFAEVWAERLDELICVLDGEPAARSLTERLSALETLLTNSNFMPVINQQPCGGGTTKVVVKECNCPLPAAVRATQIPCQLETQFLSKVVGAAVSHVSIASHRGESCRFEFLLDTDDG